LMCGMNTHPTHPLTHPSLFSLSSFSAAGYRIYQVTHFKRIINRIYQVTHFKRIIKYILDHIDMIAHQDSLYLFIF